VTILKIAQVSEVVAPQYCGEESPGAESRIAAGGKWQWVTPTAPHLFFDDVQ